MKAKSNSGLIVGGILAALAAAGLGYYFYKRNKDPKQLTTTTVAKPDEPWFGEYQNR